MTLAWLAHAVTIYCECGTVTAGAVWLVEGMDGGPMATLAEMALTAAIWPIVWLACALGVLSGFFILEEGDEHVDW